MTNKLSDPGEGKDTEHSLEVEIVGWSTNVGVVETVIEEGESGV